MTPYFPDCPCFDDAGSNVPANLTVDCSALMDDTGSGADNGAGSGNQGSGPGDGSGSDNEGLPPSFNADGAVENCMLNMDWRDIADLHSRGLAETGGLGKLMTADLEVWMCTRCMDLDCTNPHPCLNNRPTDILCYAYHEGDMEWLAWGLNSDVAFALIQAEAKAETPHQAEVQPLHQTLNQAAV
eukprot:CAMPEP_0184303506 /NCGR_PEP_ID=MMETSP1049-20130417/13248_1 /TAXON_ID=77928 /ORGANISM="Proteomonas sulcata, Strain CCMP704" /LENGTH=184 /DNA_ID=CAMNT_0026615079 /DNA_START=42 /DNA_END=594 /DNA_ORIENTATION=+